MSSSPGRRRSDVDTHEPPALRALVVDDEEDARMYLTARLRRLGFAVTYANDGHDAASHVTSEAFDLLVIDCEMPRMNGIELVGHVRRSEHCSDSYAVMVTARTDVETKIAALRAGFDDFVVKSMDEVEIIARFGAARRLIVRQRRLDAAVRELYGLATRDELTGLFNRRFLFAEAERRLAEGVPLGIVLFDLDDFKRVNDSYGHVVGDTVLHDIGTLFLQNTRHDDLIARYGGDEFVMLVSSASRTEIERIALRLACEIGAMEWTAADDRTFRVGATTGVAVSVEMDRPAVALLLERADAELYEGKKADSLNR
jgi:diguanylate cyclase (GGDEF)-like protein